MNILVTDSNYKHSLGIVRNLGQHGFQAMVLSSAGNSLCAHSKYCSEEVLVPSYEHADFERRFLDVLRRKKVELIIPVGAETFKRLIPMKHKIEKYSKLITVDFETFNIATSKKETYQFADSIGIPVPESYYPNDKADLFELKKKIKYPCVIKGLYEVGKNIIDYAHNERDLFGKYRKLCEKNNLTASTGLPLVQEYIKGDIYGFFAIYNNGKCGATFQHHRLRQMPPSGGRSVAAESAMNEKVHEYGKKLLNALNWHGVAMVEFKVEQPSRPVLIEINPKFWGSLDLALEAGANFPVELINIAENKKLEFTQNYKYPFRYHWPLHGDIDYLLKKRFKVFQIVRDFLNPKVKSNLWFKDDWNASLYMLGKFLRQTILRIRNKIGLGFRVGYFRKSL